MPRARDEVVIGTIGGLPSTTVGPCSCCAAEEAAPTLLVLPGLSPEHAVPSGIVRRGELELARAFACRRRVIWLARRPGLPAGTTIADIAADHAEAIRALGASRVADPGDARGGAAPAADAGEPRGGAEPQAASGPAQVDVLGVSTGGSIALQLAADHPQLVRRLVLVSSAARLGDAARAQQRRIAARARAGATRRALALLAADIAPPHTLRAAALAAGGWALGPSLFPQASDLSDMATVIDAEDRFDLRGRLQEITAPTLIVAGGRDRAYPRELIEQTARGIAGARLHRFARRGHVTVTLDPRFAARVERFLNA